MATALFVVLSPGRPRAEHGMPYLRMAPTGQTLPVNGRILLQSGNGVAWFSSALYRRDPKARAFLRQGTEQVPLRVVDSFDDLEGCPRAAFASEAGYGESLLVLAPLRRLRPRTTYELVLSHVPQGVVPRGGARGGVSRWEEHVLGRLTTDAGPDQRAPRWAVTPHLEYRPDPEANVSRRQDHATLVGDLRDEPGAVLVEVLWKPLGKGAPKRQILLFNDAATDQARRSHVPSTGAEQCQQSFVHGTDKDAGGRYLVHLTALDLAGHRAAAPGKPFMLAWPRSQSLILCLRRSGAKAPATSP